MDRLLHWANVGYIATLVIAAVFTIVIYQLSKQVTDAKDRQLRQYRTESEVNIAAAEARAAEANLVASEAQLELAKLKAPRTVAPEDQVKMIADLKAFTGQKYSAAVFQDPEALELLRVLDAMLRSAGWVKVKFPIQSILINANGISAPPAFHSGVIASIGQDDNQSVAALLAISDALTRAGIPCRRGMHRTELRDKSPNTILFSVGKKP